MSQLFDEMDAVDVGTCSAFFSGLLRNGFVDEAQMKSLGWIERVLVWSATMVEGIAALQALRWASSKNCRHVHILTDASEVVSGIKDFIALAATFDRVTEAKVPQKTAVTLPKELERL
ncbi:hypothetical protein RHSIM_Rhsim02G0011300 [Rhododendron simsii]|uniref:Uncharacterized protein n=1 Tax=Rhododendron simsii TaxID=118357 RepID=A0A834HCA8_RHOSS|nr:hypothetical protein RHSIM_Rhsim02G0011300 [Rhododendron simsii]